MKRIAQGIIVKCKQETLLLGLGTQPEKIWGFFDVFLWSLWYHSIFFEVSPTLILRRFRRCLKQTDHQIFSCPTSTHHSHYNSFSEDNVSNEIHWHLKRLCRYLSMDQTSHSSKLNLGSDLCCGFYCLILRNSTPFAFEQQACFRCLWG